MARPTPKALVGVVENGQFSRRVVSHRADEGASGLGGARPVGAGRGLFVRLRRHPEVWTDHLPAFRKLLLQDLWVLEGGDDHAVATIDPVGGRGHRVAVGELKR